MELATEHVIDIVMPQMGESLVEGTVAQWLRSVGDAVRRDEPLAAIETDKVNTDIESPAAGVLTEIIVHEGETVPVGTILARIVSAEAPPVTPSEDERGGGHFRSAHGVTTLSFQRATTTDHRDRPTGRPGLSPVVASLAEQASVPLDEVLRIAGSGSGGRITKRDLEAHIANRRPNLPPVVATPADTDNLHKYRYTPSPRDVSQPMSAARRAISDHMQASLRIAAHTTAMDEINVDPLLTYLAREREGFGAAHGVPLTVTTLVGFAVSRLMQEFPWMNAAVAGSDVVIRPYVHLGIAVAIEDTHNLVVPVVTDADQLPLPVFAQRLHDVVTRARAGRLELRELQNGTFTYSNPGVVGSGTWGTPILNQPQVALLATYAIRKRPWVVDDEVVARPVMGVSVTSDHRVVDGAMGFQFLRRLDEYLSSIESVISGLPPAQDGAR